MKIILSLLLPVLALLAWADWPRTGLPADARADRVVVRKAERTLTLYRGGQVLRTYSIALGGAPVGQKAQEGDLRTPEGVYRIDSRLPGSSYHLALHVDYPTAAQAEAARKRGVSAGGEIEVHGLPNGWRLLGRLHRLRDWTTGCIALTDPEMEEVWRVVPDGTPIEILP